MERDSLFLESKIQYNYWRFRTITQYDSEFDLEEWTYKTQPEL